MSDEQEYENGDPDELDLVYRDLEKAQSELVLYKTRVKELEDCLFQGLAIISEPELTKWFRRAEQLLEKGIG